MSQEASTETDHGHPEYELLYHPGIPGRGEYVRLLFEAAAVPYRDVANESDEGKKFVYATCTGQTKESSDGNPPVFAPPAVRISGGTKGGKALVISQTPNLLLYLGEHLDLAGDGHDAKYHVNQVALTALDLNNEVHDAHHPIAVSKTYEEQQEVAKLRAADLRANRLPKFFSYFSRSLEANGGEYLVGHRLSYADTTVWQLLDGLFFAYPKEMSARQKEFPALLDRFYNGIKQHVNIKSYLTSDRRLPYSMGIFRHYPELDRE